mgnify:CR=1 FL=1
MRAVILAGGKGTRLAPYTVTFPKPLVPIGDLPVLEIVIRQLADAGFEDTWLFRSGPLRNAISLGLFRREASARRHAERVGDKGFSTELKENTSLRERRWLVGRDARQSNAPIDFPLAEGVNVEIRDCP